MIVFSSLLCPASCTPVIQDYSYSCVTNSTLVTWTKDKNTLGVTVTATSSQGDSLSCSSSTNNSCVLANLLCGQNYTVQAVAKGAQCTSKPSSATQIITGMQNITEFGVKKDADKMQFFFINYFSDC